MRAICSICSDHFDGQKPVSAIPCGHTFHDSCLREWFTQSQTCPHCRTKVNRKQIIHKLFFDAPEDDNYGDGKVDTGPLHNQISTLQTKLQEKEREHSDLLTRLETLEGRVHSAQEAQKNAEVQYRQERMFVSELKQQLRHFKNSEEEAQEAIQDAKNVRRELENLKMVKKVIAGCAEDIKHILSQGGDSQQLATWCSVLKKEHALKKTECRHLRDNLDQVKKELTSKDKKLKAVTNELHSQKDQLKHSEEDLKNAEHQINSLKNKLEMMKNSLGKRSDDLDRFIMESPAPCRPAKKPRLSDPLGGLYSEYSSDSIIFGSPSPPRKSPAPQPPPSTQTFSISSAATKLSPVQKPKRNIQDISNIPGLGQLNILKKQWLMGNQSNSRIRQGYNGLGGHEKFIGFGKGTTKPLVKKVSKSHLKPLVRPSSSTLPAFPQLENFVTMDSD